MHTVIDDLDSDKVYYLRVYVRDRDNIAYSECITINTSGLMMVSTADVSGISTVSAVCGGTVSSEGMLPVISRGVVWSSQQNPTIELATKTVDGEGLGSFVSNISGLTPSTVYYVRAYATNGQMVSYGDQLTFTTLDTEMDSRAVDLGLSVKWASFNIGAEAPQEYGDYYAWAEVQTKEEYTSDTYKWYDKFPDLKKYNTDSDFGIVDNKTVIEDSDDAAHLKWGGEWRIPTTEEWQELYDNCTWTEFTLSGVKGYKISGQKVGYTDKWIFLPFSGYRSLFYLFNDGKTGCYWSSSLVSEDPQYAYSCRIGAGYVKAAHKDVFRHEGLTVRPVLSNNSDDLD